MSTPRPWMKFHPRDWQDDEGLSLCSIGARGLWIELICLMHKSERYGHLLHKGKHPTDKQLSVWFRVSIVELGKLMDELEENHVFSRTDEGVIFSRRMVDDERKHNDASVLGAKGAARRYQKDKDKSAPHRVGHGGPDGEAHNLESENRGREESLPVIPPKLGGPKTELPDDWKPEPFTEGTAAHRIAAKWDDDRLQSEVDSFCSNHRRKGSRYSDWQDTWGGWVRNAEKFDTRDARERQASAPSNGTKSHADFVLERMRIEKPQPEPEPVERQARAT